MLVDAVRPSVERINFRDESAPLHALSDTDLLACIKCPGFQERFDEHSYHLTSKTFTRGYNKSSEALCLARRGEIKGKDGSDFIIFFVGDLDGVGIQIVAPETEEEIIKLHFRDRRYDGTRQATPQGYLKKFEKLSEGEIPARSKFLGATNWYHSSPDWDKPLEGRRAVEFSIVSSDNKMRIAPNLERKKDRLWVNPETYFHFIDDPYAFIPEDKEDEKALNDWYAMWWQVCSRGLMKGKSIPLPGQTSQHGFNGFLPHVVNESSRALRPLGYTHLSGVPTWYYVWELFLRNNFLPDDELLHAQACDFFSNVIDQIKLPSVAKKRPEQTILRHLDGTCPPLKSWFAVLPYAFLVNRDFQPSLPDGVNDGLQEALNETLRLARERIIDDQGRIQYYPLLPGKNLWHSRNLKVGN